MAALPVLLPLQVASHKPVDISIIIAHRGAPMGLWMTIESCILDLENTGFTFEFRICCNGTPKLNEDEEKIKHFLGKSGWHGEFVHVAEAMAPPSARQLVTEDANGTYLFFFDNHCMVRPGYFRRALQTMENGVDYLHSSVRFFAGEGIDYSYHLCLKRDFWTEKPYRVPQDPENPYRIATAGHGGFAVRTKLWKEIGGYYQGFDGYGGEECSTDLKAWRFGKEVWIDPQVVHVHWGGKRDYDRHFTDGYYFNMFSSAYLVGGEKWLYTVFKSASGSTRFVKKDAPRKSLFDLMSSAQNRARQQAAWINERSVRTLDEALEYFEKEGIPY
jgi:hypothetical protein